MALSDAKIRAIKPRDMAFKVADSKGLYLQISPSGGKLWRFKYRIGGLEKKLALGAFPAIGLAEARKRRDAAKEQVALGIDPGHLKQVEKLTTQLKAANTFAAVAEEFIDTKMVGERKAEATIIKARWFLDLLRPTLGNRPIADITPAELLIPLKKVEAKGNFESAKRCRTFASRVFRYAVATARCETDPAAPLRGALTSHTVKHMAAIIDPQALGGLLRAIDAYDGNLTTLTALQVAPHIFVRPGELRKAQWTEFDLEDCVWRIPAERMKMRRPHLVPLSSQVVAILKAYAAITGQQGFVFPSIRTLARPMSENTINAAFRRMGYTGEEVTGHGLRTSASTLLNESGKWHPDAIERALAHKDKDAVRGAYNRGEFWAERVAMAQWWSDHLDTLRTGAAILPFPAKECAGS